MTVNRRPMPHNNYPDWLLQILRPGQVCQDDETIMAKAVELTLAALTSGQGGPFGAIIASQAGEIISFAYNEVRQSLDSTAHAEVVAIRRAQRALGSLSLDREGLSGLRLFTTCEPCLMCTGAIYWARLPAVIAATRKADAEAVGIRQEYGLDTAAFFRTQNIDYRSDFLRQTALEIFHRYAQSS